jgi:hypothetical protein|nr:hypothetical protein [uncultured Mediterranean phage uvMED]
MSKLAENKTKKTMAVKLSQREFQAIFSAAQTWLGELDEYKSKNNGKCNTFWMIMYDNLKDGLDKGIKQYDKYTNK